MQSLGNSSPQMSTAPNTRWAVKHHPSDASRPREKSVETSISRLLYSNHSCSQDFSPTVKHRGNLPPKLPAETQKSAGTAHKICLRERSDLPTAATRVHQMSGLPPRTRGGRGRAGYHIPGLGGGEGEVRRGEGRHKGGQKC